MSVQQADRCHVIERWCAAHDRPADHVAVTHEQQEFEELARLRAEAAAAGSLRAAAQVLLVEGRCLACDGEVARSIRYEGPYATVSRWRHVAIGRDTEHPVTNVLPPSGAV